MFGRPCLTGSNLKLTKRNPLDRDDTHGAGSPGQTNLATIRDATSHPAWGAVTGSEIRAGA